MRYEGDIYRPPGEWKSYLLQVTIGCSHNTCTFCSMYKNKKYRVRDIEEVLEDISMAKKYYGSVERVFLCDGDAIALPQEYLMKVLDTLYATFPTLDRVTTYAGPRSTMTKTPKELKQLHEAGLYRAYLGIETGDTELLQKCGKGVTAEEMLEAGVNLREAGIDLWGMVMIGLAGGGVAYKRNADLTAELTNKMNPKHLSALTFLPVEGTPMYTQIQRGDFTLQTPIESLLETRRLIEKINLTGLHFTSDHASNYLPIKGTLTQDREKILEMINVALTSQGASIRSEMYRGL